MSYVTTVTVFYKVKLGTVMMGNIPQILTVWEIDQTVQVSDVGNFFFMLTHITTQTYTWYVMSGEVTRATLKQQFAYQLHVTLSCQEPLLPWRCGTAAYVHAEYWCCSCSWCSSCSNPTANKNSFKSGVGLDMLMKWLLVACRAQVFAYSFFLCLIEPIRATIVLN